MAQNTNMTNEQHDDDEQSGKEKLVQNLIDMGFPKALVLQIVDNAGDVPKELIIEQLLTYSPEPSDSTPEVDDDGDELWENVHTANKMVIVINTELKMSVGKIASQAAHAALGLYEIIKERADLVNDLNFWNEHGSRKIVVEVKNKNELIKLGMIGKTLKVPYFCVNDAGLTEVAPNSLTAIAFFGSDDQLETITGKLRLLK